MRCIFSVPTLFLFLQLHVRVRAEGPLNCHGVLGSESCQGTGAKARASSLLQAKKSGTTQSSHSSANDELKGALCPEAEQQIIPMPDAKQALNDLVTQPETKQLGFIHIPQNWGRAVEAAGLKSGINWGFNAINRTYVQKLQLTEDRMCTWHLVPPRYLTAVEVYANKPLFCVTQEPTRRLFATYLFFMEMVSHHCPISQHDYELLNQFESCTPQSLNYFTMEALRRVRESLFDLDCNLMPQSTYVWDWDGNQVCSDIIQLKDLEQDFSKLMEKYSLSATLGEAALLQTHQDQLDMRYDEARRASNICPELTIADFDANSTLALRTFYDLDFKLLGYE